MTLERSLTRRRLVGASGTIAIGALAGCLDSLGPGGDGDDGNGDDENGGNESDGNETDGNETDGNESDDTLFEGTILWVTVLDEETGEPASGVTVTVTNGDYDEEDTTESNGQAFFRDLEAGEYTASAETDEGSDEETVELEEGDDGEVELEVPIPDDEEDGEDNETDDGEDNETDGNETDGNETDGNETDAGADNETGEDNESDDGE